MNPLDAVHRHEEMLREEAQAEFGVSSGIRIFGSAEGSLFPLTTTDSQAAATQVREAIDAGSSEAQEAFPVEHLNRRA